MPAIANAALSRGAGINPNVAEMQHDLPAVAQQDRLTPSRRLPVAGKEMNSPWRWHVGAGG